VSEDALLDMLRERLRSHFGGKWVSEGTDGRIGGIEGLEIGRMPNGGISCGDVDKIVHQAVRSDARCYHVGSLIA